MLEYNEEQDYDSLGRMTSIKALENIRSPTFALSTLQRGLQDYYH